MTKKETKTTESLKFLNDSLYQIIDKIDTYCESISSKEVIDYIYDIAHDATDFELDLRDALYIAIANNPRSNISPLCFSTPNEKFDAFCTYINRMIDGYAIWVDKRAPFLLKTIKHSLYLPTTEDIETAELLMDYLIQLSID